MAHLEIKTFLRPSWSSWIETGMSFDSAAKQRADDAIGPPRAMGLPSYSFKNYMLYILTSS